MSTVRRSRAAGKPEPPSRPERVEVATGVGVLDKCVTIIAAVHAGGARSLAELVEATGYSRATAHRLASALEDHRILGRDARGRWILGLRLFEWGSVAVGETGLVDIAGPVLADLRDRSAASAQLYVRDGDHRVCIASAEPRTGLRDTVPVGAPLPLDRGSGGKVLLAWADDAGDFGVEPAVLAAVRKRGWAESVSEREVGVASVSAPVRDGDGAVRAAVSVSGPIERMGRKPGDQFASAVLLAALAIERALGGPQPKSGRRRTR